MSLRRLAPKSQSPTNAVDVPSSSVNRHARRSGLACKLCRRQKARCDGLRPSCSRCSARDIECEYLGEEGETQTGVLKRRYEALQTEHARMVALFDRIRRKPLAEATEIFRRIRESTDVSSVHEQLNDAELLMEPLLTSRDRYPANMVNVLPNDVIELVFLHRNAFASIYARGTGANSLLPPKSDRSPTLSASKYQQADHGVPLPSSGQLTAHMQHLSGYHTRYWTSVTSDTNLLQHLLALYFTWQHPLYGWFDQTLFMEDYTNGGEEYCSELLVNSLLALATRISPRIDKRSDPQSILNLGVHFLAEARRLWGLTEGQDSLTRIHAGLFLNLNLNLDGKDKIGRTFGIEAISISVRLGLFQRRHTADPVSDDGAVESRFQKARAVTAWGVFIFHALESFALRIEPSVRHPPFVPIPYEGDGETFEIGLLDLNGSYPLPGPIQTKYSNTLFRSHAELCTILVDIGRVYFDLTAQEGHMSSAQVGVFFWRLMRWSDALPQVVPRAARGLPHTLILHMLFHSHLLETLRPLSIDTMSTLLGPHDKLYSVSNIIGSCNQEIHDHLNEYVSRWSLEHPPVPILQVISVAAFTLLPKANLSLERRFLETIFRAIVKASFSYRILSFVLRSLYMVAMKMKVQMPKVAREVLEAEKSAAPDDLDQVLSDYPVDLTGLKQNRQAASTETLIQEWKKLSISEKQKFWNEQHLVPN